MSLVEQAISRMRRPAGAPTTEKTGRRPGPGEHTVTPSAEPAGRRLIIDINLLRASGYLPEEDKDRQFADHYRQIKRPLIQRAATAPYTEGADPRAIMVTSALPGDGKTFTSINLALSMARERDLSVLLVDADLLKPHISRILGINKERGLTDALADETIAIDSLILPTNVRGLSVLPSGAPTEGTWELLHSARMRQISKALWNSNPRRIVLFDSPPLLVTSEGPALAALVGQVVLVVRAGKTPQRAVSDAIALIDQERAGGIILNEAPVIGAPGYYYGYGGYGDNRDSSSSSSSQPQPPSPPL
jgi:protein-tyrosine kinase